MIHCQRSWVAKNIFSENVSWAHEFLRLFHGNLLILVRGLSLWGMQLPCSSGSALPCELTGVGNLMYPDPLGFGCSFAAPVWVTPGTAMLPVCLQKQSGGWMPWYWSLWLASSPWVGLCVAVSCMPGFSHPAISLAPTCMYSIQHVTFKLFVSTNRKSAGLSFIFAVCIWLPRRRSFWLCGWHWLDHRT